jgi:hypothetical protein
MSENEMALSVIALESFRQRTTTDRYYPLEDLLEVAAEYCDESSQPSKANALRNLQVMIRREPS